MPKNKRPSAPPPPPSVTQGPPYSFDLTSTKWTAITHNMTLKFVGNIAFDFPLIPPIGKTANTTAPRVSYIKTARPPIQGSRLTADFNVTCIGTPKFEFFFETGNLGQTPASVHLIILKNGWEQNGEFDRWWSNPLVIQMAPGGFTLDVPLQPDQWSSVYGKRGDADAAALSGFKGCLASSGEIGLTFGGGSFFGHGVAVSGGTAKLSLTGLKLG